MHIRRSRVKRKNSTLSRTFDDFAAGRPEATAAGSPVTISECGFRSSSSTLMIVAKFSLTDVSGRSSNVPAGKP
jgi:hypothetical protein